MQGLQLTKYFTMRYLSFKYKVLKARLQLVLKINPLRLERAIFRLKHDGLRGIIASLIAPRVLQTTIDKHRTLPLDTPPDSLVIPHSSNPKVSIIIPLSANDDNILTCIASVIKYTSNIPYEIILSCENHIESFNPALLKIKNLSILVQNNNRGCSSGFSQAIDTAKAHHILFLHKDTVVTNGWLGSMVETFHHHDHVGGVLPKLLSPADHSLIIDTNQSSSEKAHLFNQWVDPSRPEYNYVRPIATTLGICILFPRQILEQFDGNTKDYLASFSAKINELCQFLFLNGLRLIYQPKAEVFYHRGATEYASIAVPLLRRLENPPISLIRNDHIENPSPSLETHLGRWFEKRPHHILWIEACIITPDQDSGSLRTLRLLKILINMQYRVSFIPDNSTFEWRYVTDLQQAGVEVLYPPYEPSILDHLSVRGARYALIVLSRYYVASKYYEIIKSLAPQAKIIFDTVDLHYLRLRRQAELDFNRQIARLAKLAYREEMRLINACDLTLVVSDAELRILAAESPQASVMVLSNVHDPISPISPFAARQDILFVGGFQHPPNLDAVKWYAKEIWPKVRKELPEVRTYIIGSNMPLELVRVGKDAGLDMLGFVPDLASYLAGCRLSISPLRFGAGIKGKVNQSMGHGLPVVATSLSIEGMGVEPEQSILIGDDSESFAACIIRLYQDEALWNRISQGGLRNVKQKFSSEVARQSLEKILQRLQIAL